MTAGGAVTVAAVEAAEIAPRVLPELAVRGAAGVHDHSSFALVRIQASDGATGYGEVSATPAWSGEDGASAAHFVRTTLRQALVGEPLAPVAALTARMDRVLAANPFTKAGVNAALWDALGRSVDLPVAVLLGGPFRTEVAVKFSLSGDGAALEASHGAALARGAGAFKVKVGLDPQADAARFRLARHLVGAETSLGIDANAGWSRADAVRALALMAEDRPTFVEQPLAADDLEGMRELRARGLPIVADESVYSIGDLTRLLRAEAADVVSVYVGKSGGLERAVAQGRIAAAFGLQTVIGSNLETDFGAAAQLHVAAALEALSGTIPSDVAGPLYYEERIVRAPLQIDGRLARLPSGPGLGVEPVVERAGEFQ